MSRVGRSASENPAARLTAVVVLPTPPFWLTTAMTLPTTLLRTLKWSVPRVTLYTPLMLISTGSFHVQHFPQRPPQGQHFPEAWPILQYPVASQAGTGRQQIDGMTMAGAPALPPTHPGSGGVALAAQTLRPHPVGQEA